MKYTTAWAKVAFENFNLRWAVASLSLATLILAITAIKLAARDPLVVDRTNESHALTFIESQLSEKEIVDFTRKALSYRFDSGEVPDRNYLSSQELQSRDQEQKELKARDIKQRVVTNGAILQGSEITVDSDRLMSVGQVRSALAFPLILEVSKMGRTMQNPYGLIVTRVKAPKGSNEK